MKYFFTIILVLSFINCQAFEDHPDIPDHSETDRIFKAAQKQTGIEEYEIAQLEKEKNETE